MSAVDEVLAHAATFVGTAELPPHLNRGPAIDGWIQRVESPLGSPWCAAFAWCVGADVLREHWPLLKTGSVQAMADWAKRKAVFQLTPRRGDLGLIYHAELKRYAHVFYVSGADGTRLATIEGNTNIDGSREGWGVFKRTRTIALGKIAYVRWASLLGG